MVCFALKTEMSEQVTFQKLIMNWNRPQGLIHKLEKTVHNKWANLMLLDSFTPPLQYSLVKKKTHMHTFPGGTE
jgi:hypothetical protein